MIYISAHALLNILTSWGNRLNARLLTHFVQDTHRRLYKSYDVVSGNEITSCNKIDNHWWFTDFQETL